MEWYRAATARVLCSLIVCAAVCGFCTEFGVQEKKSKRGETAFIPPDRFDVDVHMKRRTQQAQKLVERAASFFKKHSLSESLRSFEQDEQWSENGFELFVLQNDGTCLLFGKRADMIWKRLADEQSITQRGGGSATSREGLVDDIRAVAERGGWLSYEWNNAHAYAYVTRVEKEGRSYIIGTHFFPKSHAFDIQQLVNRAVAYGETHGAKKLFAQINNPHGGFRQGDLYLWAYDLQGHAYAHGRNIAMVGQDRLSWEDYYGKERNKLMIKRAKNEGHGWIEYHEKGGIRKLAFFDAFTDPKTDVVYIVGGGYYPGLDSDKIRRFVHKGVNHLRENGATKALRDFSSHASQFVQGPLALFVYDTKGVMLADGANPLFIGQNLIDSKDDAGRPFVRMLIDRAQKSGEAWVNVFENSDYRALYVKKVEIPDGTYIVGSSYWPGTKEHIAESLSRKAALYLENNSVRDAFQAFSNLKPDFLYGDLFVSVYTPEGICLVHGYDKERVWFDESQIKDDKGYPYIDRLVAKARRGGGFVDYEEKDMRKRHYVTHVKKPEQAKSDAPSHKDKPDAQQSTEVVRKGNVVKHKEPQQNRGEYIISVGYYH